MRVQIKQKDHGMLVIEAIEIIRFNNNCVGFILPYSQRLEKTRYDTYESTEPVEEDDYNRWCEQLLRTGYLDLARTDFVFWATHAKESKK